VLPAITSSGIFSSNAGANPLASQRSEADARAVYRMLQQQYPSILGNRDAVICRAEIAGQGTYYRVEIGPLSAGQADQLCGSLKAASGQCVAQYE